MFLSHSSVCNWNLVSIFVGLWGCRTIPTIQSLVADGKITQHWIVISVLPQVEVWSLLNYFKDLGIVYHSSSQFFSL